MTNVDTSLKINNINLTAATGSASALETGNLPIFGTDIVGSNEDKFENDGAKKQISIQAQELIRLAKNLNPENKDSVMKKVIANKMKALKEMAEASGVDVNEVFSEVMANMSRSEQKKISKTLKVKISKVQPKSEESQTKVANPFENANNFFSQMGGQMKSAGTNFAPSYSNTPKVKLGQDFLDKVKDISGKINCDYEDLLAVMNSESGLNSKAVNKKGGATGLIQFMPATAKALGTSTEELYNMTPTEQLEYVEKYLTQAKSSARMGEKKLSGADLYSLVFLPAKSNGEILCSSGSKEYSWNSGLDKDGDGHITKSDLGRFVASKRVNEDKVFS